MIILTIYDIPNRRVFTYAAINWTEASVMEDYYSRRGYIVEVSQG